MTTFWSLFITVITLGTIAGCAALVIWCSKDLKGVSEGEDMGHEYDGIRELNNPLPKWWKHMFWATIIFSVGYLIAFPGLGNFKGLLNWQSSAQDVKNLADSKQALTDVEVIDSYARELVKAEAVHGELFKQLAYEENSGELKAIEDIAQMTEALKVGQRLFIQNCAQCHASDARGQKWLSEFNGQCLALWW